jgi:hypothetical protein
MKVCRVCTELNRPLRRGVLTVFALNVTFDGAELKGNAISLEAEKNRMAAGKTGIRSY